MEYELDKSILSFRMTDIVSGEELSLDNVSIPLLHEYSAQVMAFLRGKKRIDLKNVKVNVMSGSLVFQVHNDAGLLDEAFDDQERIMIDHDLSRIDEVRAGIIERWQADARQYPDRVYELIKGAFEDSRNHDDKPGIKITQGTNYKKPIETWVETEKYVYGKVHDLGGKEKANIHIEIAGHGTLMIAAEAKKLLDDKTNRLYKQQLVRITADENIQTGKLRNERLVSFEKYEPKFDEEEFDRQVAKSTRAWSVFGNTNKWLEELRGNA